MTQLPPSLAVRPNIALREQTVEQLIAERDYWDAKVRDSECWGASVVAANGFRTACERELSRRQSLKPGEAG